ncbi:MAG: adenylate/guanylate cyclase domain-containing protein [Solirubrobacteraceae bacterium]
MNCPSCRHTNSESAKFCSECGAPLGRRLDGSAYVPATLAAKLEEARAASGGERKQVTVLFADVEESMKLSGEMSTEEWWKIVEEMFARLCEGVHRYEGVVDRFTGDGIMALFGAPLALEDHAQRACHAALWLQQALARYAAELERECGISFAVRLGLNSGEVVAGTLGEKGRAEYTVIGQAAGLAQRMESLAQPGTVYMTASTAALARGYFTFESRGRHEVKGLSAPAEVFELTGPGELRTRFDRSHAAGLSMYVGREAELASLEQRLQRAGDQFGQAIGLHGEAGIGKSRLCHEFVERCQRRGIVVWQANALAHTTAVPLLPVLALLREYFGIAGDDGPERARGRVVSHLESLELDLEDGQELLLEFLGIADAGPSVRTDPEARQRRLFAAINAIIAARSEREPGVILVEDLHWLDPGSATFFESLAAGLADRKVVLLATYRPGHRPSWIDRGSAGELRLAPLGPDAAALLLGDLLGNDPSLDGLDELIYERTDGNPFFIEETVKSLAEAGTLAGEPGSYRLTGTIEEVAIPTSVESVLAARIDRLGAGAKQVLQVAAVVGREFAWPVLQLAAGIGDEELRAALDELTEAELVLEVAEGPRYQIKHALAEKVAYRSQLERRRVRIHAAVAAAIEQLNPDRLGELAALIAHHLIEAGEKAQAAQWCSRAAAWSGFNDPAEALRQWRQVLQLADSGDPSEQAGLALGSRVMALNLSWRQGVPAGTAPEDFAHECKALYEQARVLARKGGDFASEAVAVAAFGAVQGLAGNVTMMADLGLESVTLAERAGDLGLRMAILPASMYSQYSLGRYAEVVEQGVQAAGLIATEPTPWSGITFVDPYASVLTWESAGRMYSGDLVGAVAGFERALAMATEHGDVEVESWIHMSLVLATWMLGGGRDAVSHARTALEIIERTGGAYSIGLAWRFMAMAYVIVERWQDAIEAAQRALAIWRPRRVGLEAEPQALTMLALAQLGLGDGDAAREAATRAAALGEQRSTRGYELEARLALAQVLRLTVGAGAAAEIERQLERAGDLAHLARARTLAPRVHAERAELARLRGETQLCERELAIAERRFRQVGATILADRSAASLAAP